MEMYILKSVVCLAVLLLFYKLLLERENMHVFKRFYLLTSVVASIVIPLITFTTYIEPSSESFSRVLTSSEGTSVETPTNYLPYIFTGIYVLGVIFFSIKFIRNLRNLILKIRKNEKIRQHNIINVLLSEKVQPHTFFSFIFFNKEKYLQDEIPQDVKIHEEAHARQKHSLDVLFIELLQIIFWFNPLIFLLKDSVKLNHEFLADMEVIKKGINPSRYQQILLAYSSGDLQSDLVNPINYSSIKKRFTVMKTQTSKNEIWARSLLLIPLVAGLIYSCSSREIIEADPTVSTSVQEPGTLEMNVDEDGSIFVENEKTSISDLQKIEKGKYTSISINASTEAPQASIDEIVEVVRSKGVSRISICSPGDRDFNISGLNPFDGEKATSEMVAEYNKLVNYYNSQPKDNREVKQEDANRIMYILTRMTSEQKAKAEKINFDIAPPPPPAPAPAPEDTPAIEDVPPPPPAPVDETEHPVPFEEIKNVPPPPPVPAPPIPAEHFKELAEEGATFYFGDKKISSAEAIQLVKNNGNLQIRISGAVGKKTVKISKN